MVVECYDAVVFHLGAHAAEESAVVLKFPLIAYLLQQFYRAAEEFLEAFGDSGVESVGCEGSEYGAVVFAQFREVFVAQVCVGIVAADGLGERYSVCESALGNRFDGFGI